MSTISGKEVIRDDEAFTSVSSCTTLLNKTGTWRTQRPFSEDKIAPCRSACPADNNMPEWLNLIKNGDFRKAWEAVMKTNPLVFTCGCVCPHPCESSCNRGQFDEALSIRNLERFLGKEAINRNWLPERIADSKEEKVAIIGSGPAGLSGAYQLARRGYKVTIFEALPIAGGMLYWGIPQYRLPKEVVAKEIEAIKRLGVEIKTNVNIGREMTLKDLLAEGYDAILVAVGAWKDLKLNVPGEDVGGVVPGIDFLNRANSGDKASVREKVCVIGGGNTAIDSARVAKHLGAKHVSILYRRSRAEMPAVGEEIEAALDEGIEIQFLATPAEILSKSNRVNGIRCIRMELGEPDESGRRRSTPIAGPEFNIEADMVIVAIGQIPELSFLDGSGTGIGCDGTISADPDTLATNLPKVFVAGDAESGPATVAQAIANGRKAALSIVNFFGGEVFTPEENPSQVVRFEEMNLSYFEHRGRQLQISNCQSAEEEASRCFSCGYCDLCGNCWNFCPDLAVTQNENHYEIDYDYCKGCGICVEECPTRSLGLTKER